MDADLETEVRSCVKVEVDLLVSISDRHVDFQCGRHCPGEWKGCRQTGLEIKGLYQNIKMDLSAIDMQIVSEEDTVLENGRAVDRQV